MSEPQFIPAGGRIAPNKLRNEPQLREALATGARVFTKLNGVYFAVTERPDGTIGYSAEPTKPAGLPAEV